MELERSASEARQRVPGELLIRRRSACETGRRSPIRQTDGESRDGGHRLAPFSILQGAQLLQKCVCPQTVARLKAHSNKPVQRESARLRVVLVIPDGMKARESRRSFRSRRSNRHQSAELSQPMKRVVRAKQEHPEDSARDVSPHQKGAAMLCFCSSMGPFGLRLLQTGFVIRMTGADVFPKISWRTGEASPAITRPWLTQSIKTSGEVWSRRRTTIPETRGELS